MKGSKVLFAANAAAVTGLGVLILVFVNLIGLDHFQRLDLTQKKLYKLDPLSREIAGRFRDNVTVRYYVTGDRFPPEPRFETLQQDVVDKLEEYEANSGGRMVLKVIDPREGKKEITKEVKEKYEAEGVFVSSHTVYVDETPTPKEYYSSIKVSYLEKDEVINDVNDYATLEYKFTKALRDLLVFEIPQVGFYFNKSEKGFNPQGNYRKLFGLLKKNFSLRAVDLSAGAAVPADIDVLFVVAPDETPDRHKFEIDQFIMRGGKAVFLMEVFDVRKVQRQNQWMRRGPAIFMKVASGVGDLLEHYGVRVGDDMVFDLDDCPYREIQREVQVHGIPVVKREKIKDPHILITKNENYDKELGFVSQLDRIGYIFAVSLSRPEPGKGGKDATFRELIRSSRRSWKIDLKAPIILESVLEDQIMNPEKNRLEKNPEGTQYPLAVLLEGKFRSFYEGKEVPDAEDDEAKKGAKEKKQEKKKPKIVAEGEQTRIIVIGDAELFSDFALPYKPNVDFLENILEWLSSEETLSRIKAKGYDIRPLDYNPKNKSVYIVLVVGVPVVLVMCLGLLMLIVRRVEKSVFVRAVAGGPQTPAEGAGEPPPSSDTAAGEPDAPADSKGEEPGA
jgi:gliding-associated putative ABC transporter substrate-binding component GldG